MSHTQYHARKRMTCTCVSTEALASGNHERSCLEGQPMSDVKPLTAQEINEAEAQPILQTCVAFYHRSLEGNRRWIALRERIAE